VLVFGRGKSQQETTTPPVRDGSPPEDGAARSSGKGRPTPKRREAELARRKPVVPSSAQAQLSANATKDERKAAKQKDKELRRSESNLRRAALYSGDDRYLSQRDKGQVRRFVRDYVDARRSVGEYFMFAAGAIVVVALLMPMYAVVANMLLYLVILVTGVDSYLLRRKIKQQLAGRFPAKGGQLPAGYGGAPTYGMLRSLQIRRMRLPKPMVKHGEHPR